MKCPECGKAAEPKGEPYVYHAKRYIPMQCTACRYFWGAPVAAAVETAPAPAAPSSPSSGDSAPPPAEKILTRVETAPAPAAPSSPSSGDSAPPPAEKILTRADGFDPEKTAIGDVVVFEVAGKQKRLTVVSVAAKSVLGDVDGKPDKRVRKDELLGMIVPA